MTDFRRLHQEAREIMLKRGKELEQKAQRLLKELEKEIIYELSKQPKTEFQVWSLTEIWKGIEELFEKWKKEKWLKTFEEEITETYRRGKEQALKILKESFKEDILEELKPYMQKGEIRVSLNQIPEKALKYTLAFPYKFAGKFSDDLKEAVREKLFLGIASGKSYLEVARELDLLNLPTVKPFKTSWDRAKTIARTETARAYHLATFDTYKEFGVEEIKVICGKSPCNKCLSHCGVIKPLSYADEVLKHPNCTCTYVAATRKGKVYDKRDYEVSQKTTEAKEYTLEKAKSFIQTFYDAFKDPLPPEQTINRFKGFFTSEKAFLKHVYKHAIPTELKTTYANTLGLDVKKDWEVLLKAIPQNQLQDYALRYFINTLRALAHPSITFYELPNSPSADPVITIYSGYRKWFCITLKGDKILSSYELDRSLYHSIKEWAEKKKALMEKEGKIRFFVEVGIDERLRQIARRLQNILTLFERGY